MSFLPNFSKQGVDCRDKPGNDSERGLDMTGIPCSHTAVT
jgi:hypothetical protein